MSSSTLAYAPIDFEETDPEASGKRASRRSRSEAAATAAAAAAAAPAPLATPILGPPPAAEFKADEAPRLAAAHRRQQQQQQSGGGTTLGAEIVAMTPYISLLFMLIVVGMLYDIRTSTLEMLTIMRLTAAAARR